MSTETKNKSSLTLKVLSVKTEFQLIEIQAEEAISQPFEYQLTTIADEAIDPTDILDHEVKFSILKNTGEIARTFSGVISNVELLDGDLFQDGTMDNNNTKVEDHYRNCFKLTIKPWTNMINRGRDCRHFIKMSALDITNEVLKPLPYAVFDSTLLKSTSWPKLNFTAQYQETTWQFLTRLWQTAGIDYYFRQNEKGHQLILTNNLKKLPQYSGKLDFESEGRPENFRQLSAVAERHTWLKSDSDIYKISAENYVPELTAACIIQCERHNPTSSKQVSKQIDGKPFIVWQLSFSAKDYGDLVCHNANAKHFAPDAYSGTFTAILESDLTAFQETRKKNSNPEVQKVNGYQSAVVVDDNFHPNATTSAAPANIVSPNSVAAVKVQFLWDRYHHYESDSSYWITHTNPVAGKNWGQQWLPRITDEVPVMFFEGDHDLPQIYGGLYHEVNSPIYDSSQHPEINGLKTQSFDKNKQTENFHELSFHDKKGQEKVHMESAGLIDKKINQNQNQTVHSDIMTTVKNQHQVKVASGVSQAQAFSTIELRVGASVIKISKGKLSLTSKNINLHAPGNAGAKPAATLGSPHQCSQDGHNGGGPILAGSPTVSFNGKSAARVGDALHCGSAYDHISEGAKNILVNGKPLALKGSKTTHSGEVKDGDSHVKIG